ncbi:MAG: DUF5681 domain-containing protein [Parvibaculaceae bacterium]
MSVRKAKIVGGDEADEDKIGYGKPPVATRFRPSQSGNPSGRPKKKKPSTGIPHMSEERLKDIIQEEAYRMISVRDGDDIVEVPVVQAIMRGLAMTAAKGNMKAQKTFTDLVSAVETDRKALNDEYLKTMIESKINGMNEIARCEELGIPVPEMTPHPDDIIIDMKTSRVEVRGPITPEDKKLWDDIRKQKKELTKSIKTLEKFLKETPDDKSLAKDLMRLRKMRAKFAELVPD